MTKATQKQVTIIARYAHKTNGKLNGTVTYLVRASNGVDTYCTTIVNGKASGCSCPAKSCCYHKKQLEAKEQERQVIAQQFAAKSVPTWTVQLVANGKLEAPAKSKPVVSSTIQAIESPLKQWVENKISTQELVEKAAPDMMKAALTTNRGFQLMR